MKNFQEKEIAFIIYKLTIVSLFVLQSKDWTARDDNLPFPVVAFTATSCGISTCLSNCEVVRSKVSSFGEHMGWVLLTRPESRTHNLSHLSIYMSQITNESSFS